jgi:hypothetical protein
MTPSDSPPADRDPGLPRPLDSRDLPGPSCEILLGKELTIRTAGVQYGRVGR